MLLRYAINAEAKQARKVKITSFETVGSRLVIPYTYGLIFMAKIPEWVLEVSLNNLNSYSNKSLLECVEIQ